MNTVFHITTHIKIMQVHCGHDIMASDEVKEKHHIRTKPYAVPLARDTNILYTLRQ